MRPAPLITISSAVKRAVGSTVRWPSWTWSSKETWSGIFSTQKRSTENSISVPQNEGQFEKSALSRFFAMEVYQAALMKLRFLDHFVSRTLLRMCYMQVLSKQRPSWQRPQFAVPATKCAEREQNSRSTCVLSSWEVGIWSIDVCNLQFFTPGIGGVKCSNSVARSNPHCGT